MTTPERRSSLPIVLLAALVGLALGVGAFLLTRGNDQAPRTGSGALATALPTGLPTAVSPGPTTSLPPEAVGQPDGRYYAVFLAVARDAHDAGLVHAQQRARALGYTGGVGDIDCTAGARSRLGLPASGTYTAYSIFFSTAELAARFATAYGKGVVGIAPIRAGCLD